MTCWKENQWEPGLAEMEGVILETSRLILREWTDTDLPDLSEMLQDPRVMYAYDHDFTAEDVQGWMARQQRRYRELGFGLWAVILRETGEIIGQAGLTMQPFQESQVLEVGYHLKYRHWHQGYAAEAAVGCRRYAFETLKAPRLHAIIKADNQASIRVAKGLGMSRLAAFMTQYYGGKSLHYLYGVDNPAL